MRLGSNQAGLPRTTATLPERGCEGGCEGVRLEFWVCSRGLKKGISLEAEEEEADSASGRVSER